MPVEISLPPIPGDPAGMRALAGALRGDVRDLEGVASGLGTAVGTMTFEGPAADRFRDETQSSTRTATGVASQLTDLANAIERKANEVEQAQHERLRKMQEIREDMAESHVPVRIVA